MQTEYKFEDLPILSNDRGSTGLLADGIATIDFGKDGLWRVKEIEIDLGRVEVRAGTNVAIIEKIAPPKDIAQRIELRLLSDPWNHRVQDVVDRAIKQAYADPESSWIKRLYTRAVEV
jgi:hypothetical protein